MPTTVPSRNDWEKITARATVLEAENATLTERVTALEQQVRHLSGGTATEEV